MKNFGTLGPFLALRFLIEKIVFLMFHASINHRVDSFFFSFFFTKTVLKFDENTKVKILEFATC